MRMNGRIMETAVLLAMTVSVLLSVLQFDANCRRVEQEVLRLHVIANSDSIDDQSMKLRVRDALLKKGTQLFSSCKSKAQAKTQMRAHLDAMQQTALQVLRDAGVQYPVQVSLTKSWFPVRTYETVTLPAGFYDAVKVVLGSGGGKNWWCVMFPPLCLPAAEEDAALEDVLSGQELFAVQQNPKYELRFWIVEKIRSLQKH